MSAIKRYLFYFLNAIESHNDDFEVEEIGSNVKITITKELANELGRDYSEPLEIDLELFADIIKEGYPYISERYYTKVLL